MQKIAFAVNGVVASTATIYNSGATPASNITGAVQYDITSNPAVSEGWIVSNVDGVVEFIPPVQAAPKPPKVSVIEYKMLFTSAERIATKASVDPVIVDLQELMNDPRTVNVDLSLQSISDALDYMTYTGLIAAGRKAEILTGEVR